MHNNGKHYLVSGRVQGVSYRASTATKAKELGLSGWVRNLVDGRVELMACGPAALLSELEAWLWQGPAAAEVTHVEAAVATIKAPSGFVVAETANKTAEV